MDYYNEMCVNQIACMDYEIIPSNLVADEVMSVDEPVPNVASNGNSHTIHDFSIRLVKPTECNAPVTNFGVIPFAIDSFSPDIKSLGECKDTFEASTCCGIKRWTKKNVVEVLALEDEFFRTSTFKIKFPDTKVDISKVKEFHSSIQAVNFVQSSNARQCIVALQDSSDRSELLETLNLQKFGCGVLSTNDTFQEPLPSLDDIDPFTLFLDRISLKMKKKDLLDMFPNCLQINVGYTNKIHYIKRYAFVIYKTISAAMDAFRKINKTSDVIVRFRLFNGSAHFPEKSTVERCQSIHAECDGTRFPIVADPGPPVLNTERIFKVVDNVTIQTETESTRPQYDIIWYENYINEHSTLFTESKDNLRNEPVEENFEPIVLDEDD